MKTLLGLLLFAVLLATGDSLECETCSGQGYNCTGQKEPCSFGLNTCQTLVVESTVEKETIDITVKSCSSKIGCEILKSGTTYKLNGTLTKIKEVTCKTPSFSASLFLTLSALLLLKIIS
ncbi:phospholipase A2 inhibitor gamma subunit B-like isoform X2 [Sphaerodactylus townsendi]|uniref:phospholipase A2 inhibitor gamma subunit B-like isoform X2 n=1 Tax=Sphaerodactylus townsendi TaxID=933632 RepID=UPI002026D50A|nr:phospholipase A2 inhibitor gamma subunit B-like isoform X2 [Sphaerodactylus townsendi]